jgi:hypothetical protein
MLPDAYAVLADILLPTLVGTASVLVAAMSWITARRATKIAHEAYRAEQERAKAAADVEADRRSSEHNLRMSRLLGEIVDAVRGYEAAAADWSAARGHNPEVPRLHRLTAAVDTARFFADIDERHPLDELAGIVSELDDLLWSTEVPYTGLIAKIPPSLLSWWRGERSSKAFLEELRSIPMNSDR